MLRPLAIHWVDGSAIVVLKTKLADHDEKEGSPLRVVRDLEIEGHRNGSPNANHVDALGSRGNGGGGRHGVVP